MKSIFTIILFSIFISVSSTAQQWASPGSEWNFTQRIVFENFDVATIVRVIDQFEENGLLISKLFVTHQLGCAVIGNEILTYSTTDGKVYFKEPEDQEYKLLYNFQANVGDSWSIPFDLGNNSDIVTYTVLHISTVDVDGHPRKMFHCNVTFENRVVESPEEAFIVEGVGDLHYLFPWQSAVCTEGFIIGLCEYKDQEIQSYSPNSGVDCATSVSVNPEADLGYFILSPNPVRESLNISLPVNAPANVETSIFNIQGKMMHQYILNKETNTQISVSDWAPGFYFVRSNMDGKVQLSKFVKQ